MLFSQFWIDPRLSWNKSEYDGISQVILHPEKAWLPDVMLVNRYELTIVQKRKFYEVAFCGRFDFQDNKVTLNERQLGAGENRQRAKQKL